MLPVIKAARLISVLLRAGFRIVGQKGSHVQLKHALDPRWKVTVPRHNKDLPKTTLRSILKQARMSSEDLLKLLGK